MILIYMTDIIDMLILTKSQGQKVKSQGEVCNFVKFCFVFKSWTEGFDKLNI